MIISSQIIEIDMTADSLTSASPLSTKLSRGLLRTDHFPSRDGLMFRVLFGTQDTNWYRPTKYPKAYQSLVGSLGWLSSSTHPNIAAAHSFLSSYTNKPAPGHMKAALYVLHYIHSTHNYGISFICDDVTPMHSYIHYSPQTDAEAYDDAVPPPLGKSDTILAYSDACWGSQLGSPMADGTLLPLFKFLSTSSGIILKNGGPLCWFW
jgi:hypothetical protein